jgi:hypothetical protein
MPVDEKTRDALDLSQLSIPAELPISRIEVEDYTDSDGEPSLRILVVLDESVQIGSNTSKLVGDLKSRIRKNLRRHGVTLFPYIFLAKQSDLDATDDEDEE